MDPNQQPTQDPAQPVEPMGTPAPTAQPEPSPAPQVPAEPMGTPAPAPEQQAPEINQETPAPDTDGGTTPPAPQAGM